MRRNLRARTPDARLAVVGLGLAGALAGLWAGCRAEPPRPPERPPNLLLISIDTLRADRLGCYGNVRETSPFLDQLAADGVRFTRAFVNTHGTTPSHATMLSSLYQESHRVGFGPGPPGAVPASVPLLQETLRDQGYLTVGVTGGGNVGRKYGFSRGFEVWNDRSRSIGEGTDRLLAILRDRAADERPVFAFFHTYQVHSPYFVPPEYENLFGTFASTFVASSENLVAHANSARADLTEDDLALLLARYDAGIRLTDDTLRSAFAELEKIGFLERAVVVVTSDHGEEFAEHGGLLHRGHLHDELIAVPLIFAGRGIDSGRVDERMVSTIDIAPTLLGRAGLAIPAIMSGRDLLSGAGRESPQAALVISQYGGARYSVRTPRWKLLVEADPLSYVLHDLEPDPGETVDVAAREPERVAELRRALASWRATQKPIGEQTDVVLDAEEIEHLRALGYL